jgi:hypothetical protein
MQDSDGTFLGTPRLPLLDGLYRLRASLIRYFRSPVVPFHKVVVLSGSRCA